MSSRRVSLAVAAMSILAGHATSQPRAALAIRHVNVIDVASGLTRQDQRIIISGDRIASIAPEHESAPDAPRTIDATGSFVIPGLWDMHPHLMEYPGLPSEAIADVSVAALRRQRRPWRARHGHARLRHARPVARSGEQRHHARPAARDHRPRARWSAADGLDQAADRKRVAAGFSPLEALQAATIEPAAFLDSSRDMGTVEAGKFADLVLLGADPLADIRNSTAVRAVVHAGRYLDRADLDRLLQQVRARVQRQ